MDKILEIERLKSKAKKIIKRITSKDSDHNDYIERARGFLSEYNLLSKYLSDEKNKIYRLSFIKSKIFQREYLLAKIKKGWMEELLCFDCDAIASPSLKFFNMISPPLILIPGNNPLGRSNAFRSILEHEIVHVNQALMNNFPQIPNSEESENLIEDLLDYTRAEYEANFIPLTQWPDAKLWPSEKIGFEEWCILRGYTAGLEKTILAYISNKTTDEAFFSCLEGLPEAILPGFKKRELKQSEGEQYVKSYPRYLKTALLTHKNIPQFHSNQRAIKTAQWISKKWPDVALN